MVMLISSLTGRWLVSTEPELWRSVYARVLFWICRTARTLRRNKRGFRRKRLTDCLVDKSLRLPGLNHRGQTRPRTHRAGPTASYRDTRTRGRVREFWHSRGEWGHAQSHGGDLNLPHGMHGSVRSSPRWAVACPSSSRARGPTRTGEAASRLSLCAQQALSRRCLACM